MARGLSDASAMRGVDRCRPPGHLGGRAQHRDNLHTERTVRCLFKGAAGSPTFGPQAQPIACRMSKESVVMRSTTNKPVDSASLPAAAAAASSPQSRHQTASAVSAAAPSANTDSMETDSYLHSQLSLPRSPCYHSSHAPHACRRFWCARDAVQVLRRLAVLDALELIHRRLGHRPALLSWSLARLRWAHAGRLEGAQPFRAVI